MSNSLTEANACKAQHLRGLACTTTQVNRLVLVVLPEADIPSAKTSTAPEGVVARPPVSAPSRDGLLQQLTAELEALKAVMKSDRERHHTEVEALKGKVCS